MAKENMMCSTHKAANYNYRCEYDRIFKNMQSVEDKIKTHICKLCGEEGGVICSKYEWESVWHSLCDNCAFKIMK